MLISKFTHCNLSSCSGYGGKCNESVERGFQDTWRRQWECGKRIYGPNMVTGYAESEQRGSFLSMVSYGYHEQKLDSLEN